MIKQHTSARAFLKWVGPLLYEHEAANSLMLGLCESLARASQPVEPAPLLLRMSAGSKTLAGALQTPPYNLILMRSRSKEIEALASYMEEKGLSIPGVIGPPREVAKFAAIWCKKMGQRICETIEQRLYRLDKVIPPSPTQGRLHAAEPRDARRLAQWLADFTAEVLPFEQKTAKQYLTNAKAKIAQRQAYIWKVGRSPVAMAFTTRPTRNGISVGPVFTPIAQRRKGYASALVADLSQRMLDEGRKFCVLYTDLSNPTSNKIYTDIGYRPIADSLYVIFN